MSKKNIITIFLSAICTLPLWGGQQYYAFLKGDTLRMGNNYMERVMLWNNGAPVTISLTDKQHGKTIPVQGKQPDFSIVKGIPTDATFTVNEIPTNGIHASYLQATVACTIGSLNIERRYRIYADCPAIACDTYLKGQVELYQNKEDNRSNADRKNIEHTADMATGGENSHARQVATIRQSLECPHNRVFRLHRLERQSGDRAYLASLPSQYVSW